MECTFLDNRCKFEEIKKGELFFTIIHSYNNVYMKVTKHEYYDSKNDDTITVNAVDLNGDIAYFPDYQVVIPITDYKLEIKRD